MWRSLGRSTGSRVYACLVRARLAYTARVMYPLTLDPTPVGVAAYLVALRPDANSYMHCVPVRCTLACDNVALRALSLWSFPDIKWRHGPPATLTASADILCPLATAAQDRWANNAAACPRPLAPGERGWRDVAALDDGDRPIA